MDAANIAWLVGSDKYNTRFKQVRIRFDVVIGRETQKSGEFTT